MKDMINKTQRNQLKIKVTLVLNKSYNIPMVKLTKQRTWKSKAK